MAEVRGSFSLGGFDDEFVNDIEDDWHCPICQLPLKEAVQTGVCGHRFCRQCLEEHFARQERDLQPPSCPVDRNNLIRDRDIFPDKATDRRILSFIIKCPSEGCEWTGELRSKDNHLASCPLKVDACTNKNCHVTLPRKDLQEHMTITCPWRVVPCSHCDVSHAVCHTEAHQSECRRFPLSCPNNCGFVIPREEVLAHVEKDCIMAVISCPYAEMGCATKVQRKEVGNHLQSDMRMHLDLACIKLSNTQEELRNTTRKLEEKISALENKPLICHSGIFTWKISGFHEILTQAKTGRKTRIQSVPFYIGECGYKFRIHLYPNGNGAGINTFLSVFILLMKGEYDSILNWPFRQKITVRLIDQQEDPDDRENIAKSLSSDSGNEEWRMRPVTEKASGKGFYDFVSHVEMRESRYLVDDTMFIQVQFFPPQQASSVKQLKLPLPFH